MWAGRHAAKSKVCLLLIYKEHMPLGAASGGQQGAQNAAASATLRWRGLQTASRGRRFRVALPLWCAPASAEGRDPHVRAEIRLSMCWMCDGTSGETIGIRLGMPVTCLQCRQSESWDER